MTETRKRTPRIGPRGLTVKQEAFAQAVVRGENYSDAYREAFEAGDMSNEAIHVESSRLAGDPNVSLRIDEILQEAAALSSLTEGEVIEGLRDLIAQAQDKDQLGTACKGYELLGKAQRLFVDRVQNDGGEFGQLSAEDAANKIADHVLADPDAREVMIRRLIAHPTARAQLQHELRGPRPVDVEAS